jgi:hypothetical protein
METANHLYGVTMMEPGVSSIVSVSFHDVAETQSDQELAGAISNQRKRLDEKAPREPQVGDQEEMVLADEEVVVEEAEAVPEAERDDSSKQLEASE